MANYPAIRIRYVPEDIEVEVGLMDLLQALNFALPGHGTVTSVAVASANGISGTVANPTTAASITLDLGAISPDSVTSPIVTGLNEPTTPTDAATKAYVDSVVAGLVFIPPGARVGTTAALDATYSNGTLGVGATLTNAGTQAAIAIDDVSLSANDIVLVKDQAAPAQNGIYKVTTVGSGATNWVLTRTTNYDTLAEITTGSYTSVGAGTVNVGTLWIMTGTDPITVGTTAIVFTSLDITGSGSVTSVGTGTGLTGGPITTTGTISIANLGVDTAQLAANAVTTVKVTDKAITYAKIQDVAASSLLGNPTGSTAATSEITLGSGLAFAGTTLTATGTGGTVTSVSVVTANGISGTVATATTTPAITLAIANGSIVLAKLANLAGVSLLGNPTGSAAAPSAITLGSGLEFVGTTLQATGSGGTVTSIATGTGLTGGTITDSGTIALATISNNRVLANISGGTLAPSANTLTAIIDSAIGSTQGNILYRDSSVWSVLAPGSAGQPLKSQGAAANPAWADTGLKISSHYGTIGTGSIVTGTATLNLATNDWYNLTLAGNATTIIALSNVTVGQQFTLRLIQDGTGAGLVTWFSGITWAGGSAPTLSAVPGSIDIITFKCTATNTYDGFDTSGDGGGGTGTSGVPFIFGLALGGDAAVANDLTLWELCLGSGTFTQWSVIAKTAPVGADLIIDIKKSSNQGSTWTSLWATHAANRPTIADGAKYATGTAFDTTTYSDGDILRIDIIQVGSGTAGSNIAVRLK